MCLLGFFGLLIALMTWGGLFNMAMTSVSGTAILVCRIRRTTVPGGKSTDVVEG